jgi:SAM-dependent methyltransferase
MGLIDLAKRAVRRNVALTCAWYVLDDWRASRRLASGRFGTRSGARHATLSLEESLAYIERVHADYLTYAGRERFAGIVAEIGPGDNFGVALLVLGNGAEEVHAIDRYASVREAERHAAILRALASRHGLAHLFDGARGERTLRGLIHHPGLPAERFFRESGLAFDAIVSRAVIEHLYDPIAALDDMARALRPGGVMVHRIDLRDHGMFAGRHPLTFLTVPDPLYRRMTRASGRPNRVLLPAWRAWLDRAGLPGSLRITRLAGVDGEIAPAEWDEVDPNLREQALACVGAIRPHLAAIMAPCDDRDLAVSGCVLVAAKPKARATPAT